MSPVVVCPAQIRHRMTSPRSVMVNRMTPLKLLGIDCPEEAAVQKLFASASDDGTAMSARVTSETVSMRSELRFPAGRFTAPGSASNPVLDRDARDAFVVAPVAGDH